MVSSDVRPGEYVVLREEEMDLPSQHDMTVLQALGTSFDESDGGHISFQGIRRKLGLHQETLSRALRRLERDGFIVKKEREYQISPKGEEIIAHKARKGIDLSGAFSIPILRTILPPDMSVEELEATLAHRWFANLRWFGASQSGDTTVMTWITPDGKVRLTAKISEGYLSIESQATTSASMSEAVRSAYEIFEHVSRAIRQLPARPARPGYRAA